MENSLKQKALEATAKVDSNEVYRGVLFSVKQDILHFEELPPHQWDTIIHPGAVAIIPVTKDGNLLLIQQWRRAVEKIIYEIPAGTLDKGEAPLICAQRELQEETGFKATTLTPLGGFYSAPGFCTEYLHLFVASGLSPSPLAGDDHEAIDVLEVPLKNALEMIDSNVIDDAKTITGILRYERWARNA